MLVMALLFLHAFEQEALLTPPPAWPCRTFNVSSHAGLDNKRNSPA